MTHWILQNNLYSEEGFESLTQALETFGFSYSIHKCVPFIGTLEPEADPPPGPVIVMGSYTLANHAKTRGWTPGAWLDNLDYRVQLSHWGDRMLNADAVICIFDKVPKLVEPFFLRPVHDTKAFTGKVYDWPEYNNWADSVSLHYEKGWIADNDQLTPNTPVMVSSKKEIYSETRTWIVGGRIVTASGYKVGTLKRYTMPHEVDARITDFAQECADLWSPNEAYVLDVADTANGLKIVEINNLNSAGFYKADMQRLTQALDALVEGNLPWVHW